MSLEEFAQKFIKAEDEAWLKGNLDPLEALEDPNVVYHMAPPMDFVGFEAHKQQILGARMGLSDIKQEWKYLTSEGNLFALSYKAHYISLGTIPGFPSAGKEVTSDSIFLLRLENGKIVEAWSRGSTTGVDLSALAGK